MIFERHANLKYKYGNRHFWCRGYYVDTVGKMQRRYKNIFKISYTGRLIYAYSHYNMCAGCFCLL
nr:transposase [Anaerostipes hadrus]